MSKMIVPDVDELGEGFDKAAKLVQHFEEALMLHVGARKGQWDMDKYFNSVFSSIKNFDGIWDLLTIDMKESFETFDKGTATIITLVSSITSLVDAFQTLADMPLITSDQIVAGFEKIKDTIEEVNKGMKQFAAEGLCELIASLKSVAKQWLDWDEKLGDSDSTFGEAVTGITALVNAITDLIDVQKRLVKLEGVSDTEWLSFFDKIAEQVDQLNKGMLKFGAEGVNALTNDLAGMGAQWASWTSQVGTSLTSFDDASSGIGGLANSVSGLVGAFTALAEMPVMPADAFSASMKDMSKNIENFASALKDNIATIEKALEAVDDAWSDYADDMAKLVPIFKDATDAINTLAGGIMSVVRSFELLKEVEFEEVFATGFENLTNATGEFATALKNNIDGLLTSLNALVNAWLENEDETVKLMRAFITISSNFMIVIGSANALQDAFSSMDAESDTLGKGFKELTEFMNEVIEGVQKIYTADVAADLAQFVIDVGHVIDALADLETSINTAMGLMHNKIETTVNDAKVKVSELSNIPSSAYTWGADIIYSFVNGMKAMEFYLRGTLKDMTNLIEEYMGVGSNTKLGALSHLTDWPKNLITTFADGIKRGTPEISKALSSLTLPVENLHIPGGYAGLLGGAGDTFNFYNTWNVDNQQDADYAVGEIENMLLRRRVL
jgi:ABC-type transporter Mla subunit MlaD